MIVKKLIEDLQQYDPDTELIVAYWDKDWFNVIESETTTTKITDDQWSEIVSTYENGEWYFQSVAADDLLEIAAQVVSSEEEE